MRHLKDLEKLVILLSFQKNFLMLQVTGTLTGLNTMTIFRLDYSVRNLYSKWLFCFPWFSSFVVVYILIFVCFLVRLGFGLFSLPCYYFIPFLPLATCL